MPGTAAGAQQVYQAERTGWQRQSVQNTGADLAEQRALVNLTGRGHDLLQVLQFRFPRCVTAWPERFTWQRDHGLRVDRQGCIHIEGGGGTRPLLR